MAYTPIPYMWNRTTSVVKQGKYRISMKSREPVVEVLIETADDMRIYPSSKAHPQLVEMVNAVKTAAGLAEGGQFYINEYRQVIVPATNFLGDDGVDYFYAGEYRSDIILALDGIIDCVDTRGAAWRPPKPSRPPTGSRKPRRSPGE